MSGRTVRRWAHTSSTFSKYIAMVISVLLLGDRWPLKPAVIATYRSGICDQYCLYRENFKYKLHRISVCEDKSPVWRRSTPAQPRRFLPPAGDDGTRRGNGDGGLSPAWPRAPNRFVSSLGGNLCQKLGCHLSLCFLNRFGCKIIFTARPSRGLSCAAVLEPEPRVGGRIRPLSPAQSKAMGLQNASLPFVALARGCPGPKLCYFCTFPTTQLAFRAKPAWTLPSGNIPFFFRNWTVGIN